MPTSTRFRSVGFLLIAAFGVFGARPCMAQTPVTSLDEVRRKLATGDHITVVPAAGQPVSGRLLRFGDADLQVELVSQRTRPARPNVVTVPLDGIASLERRRDPVRNGIAIGAGVGAGIGGALFVYALAVDRNDIDEWGAAYVGVAGLFTGIGALTGWAMDAARSKPHVRFEAAPRKTTLSIAPTYSRRSGVGLALTFAR